MSAQPRSEQPVATPPADSSDPARRMIHVALLEMPTISHNNYGLWAHPDNQKVRYKDLSFWIEIAKLAEAAKLDAVFFADLLGVAAGYQGSMDTAIEMGIHVPILDPLLVVPAMAAATSSVGFGATVSATYEPPFGHARRMSTLDHLTDGRIGWNVVMSYTPNANENFGLDPSALSSADRYDRAEEFMDVCYRLWEYSWDSQSVVADRTSQIYADPRHVRRIDYQGTYYNCAGPHLVEPSPQRTPVIFQAGMSDRGRAFSARHAEVSFVVARTEDGLRLTVKDIRGLAAANGRGAYGIRVLAQGNVIVGRTKEEAAAKLASFQELTRAEGYLAHEFGGGFDPLRYPRSMRLNDAFAEAGMTRTDSGTYGHGPDATIGEVIDAAADLRNECLFAASDPGGVADAIEGWVDQFDLDGFLLRNYVHPGTLADFGALVVPELQRRGRYRTEYEGSTLREHLFGAGQKLLPDSHPGAVHRAS